MRIEFLCLALSFTIVWYALIFGFATGFLDLFAKVALCLIGLSVQIPLILISFVEKEEK